MFNEYSLKKGETMLSAQSFFNLENCTFSNLFDGTQYVWEALKHLKTFMESHPYLEFPPGYFEDGIPLPQTVVYWQGEFYSGQGITIEFGDATKGKLEVSKDGQPLSGASVVMAGAVLVGRKIHLGEGVLIEPGAYVKSPTLIGSNSEIRQGAYMRGYCLVGKRCVVGHVTEMKHSVLLNDAKAGHFAYVGDAILGNDVNLGAGTKMANLRFMGGDVQVRTPDGSVSTGLRKMSAVLGDHVQTGCNSVTNPGTLIGKKSLVFPNTTVNSGYHGSSSIIR